MYILSYIFDIKFLFEQFRLFRDAKTIFWNDILNINVLGIDIRNNNIIEVMVLLVIALDFILS